MAAGLTLQDPRMAMLFRIGRVCDASFLCLHHSISLKAGEAPCHDIMAALVLRGAPFASWSGYQGHVLEPAMQQLQQAGHEWVWPHATDALRKYVLKPRPGMRSCGMCTPHTGNTHGHSLLMMPRAS